jgi:hypothetical protein
VKRLYLRDALIIATRIISMMMNRMFGQIFLKANTAFIMVVVR